MEAICLVVAMECKTIESLYQVWIETQDADQTLFQLPSVGDGDGVGCGNGNGLLSMTPAPSFKT